MLDRHPSQMPVGSVVVEVWDWDRSSMSSAYELYEVAGVWTEDLLLEDWWLELNRGTHMRVNEKASWGWYTWCVRVLGGEPSWSSSTYPREAYDGR